MADSRDGSSDQYGPCEGTIPFVSASREPSIFLVDRYVAGGFLGRVPALGGSRLSVMTEGPCDTLVLRQNSIDAGSLALCWFAQLPWNWWIGPLCLARRPSAPSVFRRRRVPKLDRRKREHSRDLAVGKDRLYRPDLGA